MYFLDFEDYFVKDIERPDGEGRRKHSHGCNNSTCLFDGTTSHIRVSFAIKGSTEF